MVVNIFFEWFVMKFVNKLYAKKVIMDYKKEVEKEKLIDTQKKVDNKEYEPNNFMDQSSQFIVIHIL